jgi:hypothetical protein
MNKITLWVLHVCMSEKGIKKYLKTYAVKADQGYIHICISFSGFFCSWNRSFSKRIQKWTY